MPAREDTWAFDEFNCKLPDHPVRIPGQQNMYVALWYKNRKDCHGGAYYDGGSVYCSFANGLVELSDKSGGQIQILTYKGEYKDNGFWLQWLPIKTKDDGKPNLELVRCGMSTPITMKTKDGEDLLGFLDLGTGAAMVGNNGKSASIASGDVKNCLGIFRTFSPPPTGVKNCDDIWFDASPRQDFPSNAKLAHYRDLSGDTSYVALWYKYGEPVFGCCKPLYEDTEAAAEFAVGGWRYCGWAVGIFQMLVTPSPDSKGLQYAWRPWSAAKAEGFGPSIEGKACGPLLVLCKKRK